MRFVKKPALTKGTLCIFSSLNILPSITLNGVWYWFLRSSSGVINIRRLISSTTREVPMNHITASVRNTLLPALMIVGLAKPAVKVETTKVESENSSRSMRTYYICADGHVTSKRPESYIKTVRAESIASARKLV